MKSPKKELDAWFSKWVRLSHADAHGNVACYTCGIIKPWKKIQCGHFVRRQYLATRFDPRNCRPQCVGCNIYGDGKTVEFAQKLEVESPGIVALLFKKASDKIKKYPYAAEIERYKRLVEQQAAWSNFLYS